MNNARNEEKDVSAVKEKIKTLQKKSLYIKTLQKKSLYIKTLQKKSLYNFLPINMTT